MSNSAMGERARRAIEQIEEQLDELRHIVVAARRLDATDSSWLDDSRVIQQRLDDWQLRTVERLYEHVHPQVGVKFSGAVPESYRLDASIIEQQTGPRREFLLELIKALESEPERIFTAPLEERTMIEQIEEREQRSFAFLCLLYDKTVGENDRYRSVSIAELGAELGLFPLISTQDKERMSSEEKDALLDEGKVVEQLVIGLLEEDKVEGVGQPNPYYDSNVRITRRGIQEVTNTLRTRAPLTESTATETLAVPGSSVFIVHGHDTDTLAKVENVLHRIGAKPYTFSRIPKRGSPTVIEVLEETIHNFSAILVLMTPDDEGRKRDTSDTFEPRARQNVIAEAGFALISRRNSSFILAVGDVSIPTDFEGIHRVQCEEFDRNAEHEVAKRLQEIGLAVDTSGV